MKSVLTPFVDACLCTRRSAVALFPKPVTENVPTEDVNTHICYANYSPDFLQLAMAGFCKTS